MRHLPLRAADAIARLQRPGLPLFGPSAPLATTPEHLLDATALYAGETALRIGAVVPAAQAVAELAGTTRTDDRAEGGQP